MSATAVTATADRSVPRTIETVLRPYLFHIALASYLPILLLLDARVEQRWQQHLLGVATALFLLIATRFSTRAERRFVWAAVGFWTAVELLGSIIWGIYIYRFDNLPLYVPFGHGLIYLFGLRALRTPLAERHTRVIARTAVVIAISWALAGVTILPLLTGRVDIAGALLMPIFVYGITRSRAALFYAAVFVATSALEIIGTSLGNWYWVEIQPLTLLPQGNPPSVIAGAYCIWDSVASRLARRTRLLGAGLPIAASGPPSASTGTEPAKTGFEQVSRFWRFRGIL
jgi:hypothetical protein